MPIGMLRKKNHRHDAYSVSKPATNGPSADPIRPTPDQIPSACARSSGGNALFTTETEVAKMVPPPTPWSTRAPMRKMSLSATMHSAEPTTNTTTPARTTLRRPRMSASRPTGIMMATNASR